MPLQGIISPAITNTPWSITVFLACVLIFAASVAMFRLLDQRWTRYRHQTALHDWAYQHNWRPPDGPAPAPPAALASLGAAASVIGGLESQHARLLQARTASDPTTPPTQWNLLVCQIDGDWPMTALRPDGPGPSFANLFPLELYPALSTAGRFTVLGVSSTAARHLAHSAVRGLLPPDVSLLLSGHELILDFSTRPFDPIAFERVLSVVKQIIPHLPVLRRH